jgi:hypothetical protein
MEKAEKHRCVRLVVAIIEYALALLALAIGSYLLGLLLFLTGSMFLLGVVLTRPDAPAGRDPR